MWLGPQPNRLHPLGFGGHAHEVNHWQGQVGSIRSSRNTLIANRALKQMTICPKKWTMTCSPEVPKTAREWPHEWAEMVDVEMTSDAQAPVQIYLVLVRHGHSQSLGV